MPDSTAWRERPTFVRSDLPLTSSSASHPAPGVPALRSIGWSIAVVLAGGVLAAFSTPAMPARTVLQQGSGPAMPAEVDGTGAPEAAAAPASTAAPAVTAGPVGSSSTPAGPAATVAPTTKARAKAAAAPRPAATAPPKAAAPAATVTRLAPAPGAYPLRISGTSSSGPVPTTGSLIVESKGGDQQQRAVGVPGDVVVVQRASAAGVDVVSFSLSAGGATMSFTPPAPLPFVRTSGSWSWSVQSSDRAVTVDQTATASSAGSVDVGGTQVPAVTVTRVFNVSGASASGTVRLTTTVSLLDRLPLVQQQAINVTGTAFGGWVSKSVTSESTATLTSLTPR